MSLRTSRFAIGLVLCTIISVGGLILADPASPVTVAIVDSPDPVASGAEILYTTTIVNTGGSKLTNVVFSDQVNGIAGIGVPPQLQLSSTRGSCNQNGNLVTCNGGTIPGNGSWLVTIRGVVTAANGTVINNTATVSGTRSAQNFTTTSTATTLVSNGGGSGLADLTIGKAGPTSVVVSSPMTYTLTINNTGTANATGVKVVDTVPAGVTGITATGTSLFVCNVAGQTVTCDGGAVNQGANATVTIDATSPAATGTITNTAVVDPDNTIPETNDLNNTSALVNTQVTTSQTSPKLTIDKTDGVPAVAGNPAWAAGAGPDPVVPGATLTYKIHVVNTASTRADDVRVVDGTQGLVAASVTATQVITNGSVGTFGGCTVEAPQTTCSIKSLNPGGTMDVTITGQVITSAGSTIFNTATVTGNIQNKGVTATDSEITTVRPAVDLTITKGDSPDPVCAASWPGSGYPAGVDYPAGAVCQGGLTYTFVIGNSGVDPAGATNVVVRDPLPTGLIFDNAVNVDGGGFVCSYDVATNVVTCSGGSVPPQSTRTLKFILVAPAAVGPISNTVTVDPNNAIFEADETNNTFTQVTQVSTGIDLTVAKHSNHEADFVATRGTLTYTIKVPNLGTQDATNILVRDTLPADTIFRDAVADPAHGFTCAHAGGVVDCSGGHVQGTKSMNYPNLAGTAVDAATITIRIFATAYEQAAMHNEVRVDPLNTITEANELNNVAVQNTKVQRGGATNDAFNELTISKQQMSPDKTNTARNAVVTYEIKVGNNGSDPVTGVKVRDTLPAGMRYIEATGTNSFLCQQGVIGFVDCGGGQIAANTPTVAGATITIKAFAPDTPGTYINQVIADPDNTILEGDEFNNQATETTTVANGGTGAFNDLTVAFQLAPASTAGTTPGGAVTYRLDVFNIGTDAALNVAVRDILPASVTFVSAADAAPGPGAFTCTESEGVVDCVGATIPGTVPGPAGSRTIVINVTAPNHVETLTNQAIADPDNAIPEGDETNNTATFLTSVSSIINLNITKNGPQESSQSSPGQYDIVMTNQKFPGSDGQTAFHVRMQDPFPVGLIPLAVDMGDDNNWQCSVSQNPVNVLDCVGDLEPDKPVTIKFYVFMTAESGKPLDNEACFVPNPDVPPGFPTMIEEYSPPGTSDNCSTASTVVNPPPTSPDLFVTKSVEPGLVAPGDDLTYTILIANNGTAKAATPLTLTDNLPTGSVTFVDATGTNGWTCTGTGPVVCHDGGLGLGIGESATITIHAKVKDTTTLPFVNIATADAAAHDAATDPTAVDETPGQLNNTATVKSSVNGSGFDLAVSSITDNPDPAGHGQGLKYTIVAVNGGTADATGVHVAITLPAAGLTFVGADGSNGFNCTGGPAGPLDCSGDLPGGGDTVITVNFTVTVGVTPPDVTLSATIDPTDAFVETDEGNNTLSETTTITGTACMLCVDLVSAQLVPSPDPASSGGSVTFTYQVVNAGDIATSLDTDTQNLLTLNAQIDGGGGSFTPAAPISSNPAITCTSFNIFGFSLNSCKGNLAPGEGVTITLTLSNLSGSSVFIEGKADPNGHVFEVNESNNNRTETVLILP